MSEEQFPYIVDWAVTGECNLSCRHCRGVPKSEISTERAKKLIDEIAELNPSWVLLKEESHSYARICFSC